MLLEDMGPRLATEVVLEAVFDKQMSPGVRQNIAEDLQEDEPWSQHAVVAQQSGIFTAVVLLHRAMPKYFGRPDAICFDLKLQTSAPEAKAWLTDQIDPALLVRLLAQGMAPQTTLNRLYEDELAGDSFPSAKDILWQVSKTGADHYSVISSGHWVGTLEDCTDWSASAAVDKPVKR